MPFVKWCCEHVLKCSRANSQVRETVRLGRKNVHNEYKLKNCVLSVLNILNFGVYVLFA